MKRNPSNFHPELKGVWQEDHATDRQGNIMARWFIKYHTGKEMRNDIPYDKTSMLGITRVRGGYQIKATTYAHSSLPSLGGPKKGEPGVPLFVFNEIVGEDFAEKHVQQLFEVMDMFDERTYQTPLKVYPLPNPQKRKDNPTDDYGLRQYIIKDGKALYIARIEIRIYSKKKYKVIEYLDWLLKLPGLTAKKSNREGLTVNDPIAGEIQIGDYDFRIDLDNDRYFLSAAQIDRILEEYDLGYRINDKLHIPQ